MTSALELTRRSYADIDVLFAFVKERSGIGAAQRWRNGLFTRLVKLENQPEIWPFVENEELSSLGFRECLYHHWRHVYRILYRIDGNIVRIHRIRSAAQDQLSSDDV